MTELQRGRPMKGQNQTYEMDKIEVKFLQIILFSEWKIGQFDSLSRW
jgi:hypothetical protein